MGSNKEGFMKETALLRGFETGTDQALQRAVSAELTASVQAPKVSRSHPWAGEQGENAGH